MTVVDLQMRIVCRYPALVQDVICGRKTQGLIRGDILVNSHPKQQATWSRVVG